ncbi:MAG: DUF4055 domain-containing protein [Parvibaculaceae bacterium]|nr:DUF4055 domain-containing protein [Parvibaculaceae bacterium]
MSNSVAEASTASQTDSIALRKVRALRSGVEAMRAAGEAYLPREELETWKDYKGRRDRSWLYPGLDKATEDMADKVFARPVKLGDNVPAELKVCAENITNDGQTLNEFARLVFEDAIDAGVSYVLVDAPERPDGLTKAEEDAINFRPYLNHIQSESILGWKTDTVNNVTKLSQIRIKESIEEDDPTDRFKCKEVDQIRVYETTESGVACSIYRKIKDNWTLHSETLTGLDEITIVPVYTNRKGFFKGSPLLDKLADLNIAHWQSASDQRNVLHKARVPILMLSGVDEKAVKASVNYAIVAPDAKATGKFIEHSGAAIASGRDDLKDLEATMQALGMQMMMPKTGSVTATSDALDQAAMDTPLSMMAQSLEDALTTAFQYMAEYKGLASGGNLTVNKDFGLAMLTQADHELLLKLYQIGAITRETLLKEIQRRGILMDDFDPEVESERVADEAMESIPEVPDEEQGGEQEDEDEAA